MIDLDKKSVQHFSAKDLFEKSNFILKYSHLTIQTISNDEKMMKIQPDFSLNYVTLKFCNCYVIFPCNFMLAPPLYGRNITDTA